MTNDGDDEGDAPFTPGDLRRIEADLEAHGRRRAELLPKAVAQIAEGEYRGVTCSWRRSRIPRRRFGSGSS